MPNNAINSDVQKRRFALLLHAGYGGRWASLCLAALQNDRCLATAGSFCGYTKRWGNEYE